MWGGRDERRTTTTLDPSCQRRASVDGGSSRSARERPASSSGATCWRPAATMTTRCCRHHAGGTTAGDHQRRSPAPPPRRTAAAPPREVAPRLRLHRPDQRQRMDAGAPPWPPVGLRHPRRQGRGHLRRERAVRSRPDDTDLRGPGVEPRFRDRQHGVRHAPVRRRAEAPGRPLPRVRRAHLPRQPVLVLRQAHPAVPTPWAWRRRCSTRGPTARSATSAPSRRPRPTTTSTACSSVPGRSTRTQPSRP